MRERAGRNSHAGRVAFAPPVLLSARRTRFEAFSPLALPASAPLFGKVSFVFLVIAERFRFSLVLCKDGGVFWRRQKLIALAKRRRV